MSTPGEIDPDKFFRTVLVLERFVWDPGVAKPEEPADSADSRGRARLTMPMQSKAEEIWFRIFFNFVRIFGIVFRAIAVLIGLCALADLLRLTHFGYPDFSLIFLCGFYAVGHYISKFGRLMLQSQREPGI
ncbi:MULTISPECIES: hypothetical protein [unclassified Mesorhizobium]|uniref:hypothetical protein n=1 Tax=unclassified Mesorhizobium TaxID=325217 RepID=UPI000FCBF52D|nr:MULTISPECIES: hypothetical protein [unclassified Mesorhizobium]RUW00021.1 hypothetical protein EOA49_17410 [Mesorhizobium sp. M1A.F.Ca.IN.020.04.1.1]RUW16329.1 hypothetical protein EOA53_00835 [Mesorhizobium sp. M1A.F.Ca.IN.020.03.1.1]RWF75321.1 MAG: hypothetical protein EOQ34_02425 [Mesorhizobium sp.]RWG15801.1 MAG: hypothetical protein EOQ58_10335 [Mesorhizobium sp.]RWG31377.1 MAG: hypothetical protein EOQ61_13270 [Mesorhizobium sp.]